MNTHFRAFGNVRICSISARWLNLRAFRQKVRVLRLARMAGQNKIVHFLKLRSVALNYTGLRKVARVVALFCTRGCTTNDQENYCQRSERGFLPVWPNCARFGELRAFCQHVFVWLFLYSFWGLNTYLCMFEVPGVYYIYTYIYLFIQLVSYLVIYLFILHMYPIHILKLWIGRPMGWFKGEFAGKNHI